MISLPAFKPKIANSMLPHSSRPGLLSLNHRRPGSQPLVPRPRRRELLLPLLQEILTHHVGSASDHPEPRHHGDVGVGAFIAYEELLVAVLLEVGVDDADDALDFVAVAVEAGFDFLGVVLPCLLAILREAGGAWGGDLRA